MEKLKHIIEGYKAKNIGTEAHMWEAVKLIDEEILCPMMEMHPDLYWSFIRDIHEIYEGEHYDKKFAEYEVSMMEHKGTDGTVYKGAKWGLEQTTPIFAKIKSQLIKPYNEFDWFVILNSIWHDNCVMYHKWFPNDTEEQMTQHYIDSAINWLNDEDYGGKTTGKVWSYFDGMREA